MLQEMPGHGGEGGLEDDARPAVFVCPLRSTDPYLLVEESDQKCSVFL